MATRHGLQEPGPKLQVSIFFCEQTHLRRRMVTGGDYPGTARIQDSGGGKHETDCRWIPRAALAHGQRMVHHAFGVRNGTALPVRLATIVSANQTTLHCPWRGIHPLVASALVP